MPKNHQKFEKELKAERKNAWSNWNEATKKEVFAYAEKYKNFLNTSKTENETVIEAIKLAEAKGFKNISKFKTLKPGDRVYAINRGKCLYMATIGKKRFEKGIRLLMAHADSPHLDFKVNPLYEDESLAFMKTHYYGGIKKYQWPTIALALHGTVYLANGKKVEVRIGENESDPVFMITDLLPHLDRGGGPGSVIKNREVKGEDLNLLVGSIPVQDDKIKEKVKLAILEFLHNEYGIIEDDLVSAELQAVPSEKARDLGFDRSLISAYGHDDRLCVFGILSALLNAKTADATQVCALVDREEIGSEGNTGAKSLAFELFISDLIKLAVDEDGHLEEVYRVLSRSYAISADVTAALDPDYKEVHDPKNAPRMGFGLAIERYTGAGGKYSTSEASGQFISELRTIFSKDKDIAYQISGGLGKIDLGGGGTIAKYLSNRNMEVVDMGVSLFNLHAPLEIASKADLYCAYLGYKAFIEHTN